MSPRSNRKQVLGQWSALKKHITSMSYKPKRDIASDTGQRMPCIDRCQFTITWMSNIKDVRCKPRLGIGWSMTAMLRDIVAVVVGCTRQRFMPLVMMTTKKELRGFLSYACMWFCSYSYGATLSRQMTFLTIINCPLRDLNSWVGTQRKTYP